MQESIYVSVGVEDELSEELLKAILSQVVPRMEIVTTFGYRGNSYLKRNVRAFNTSAKGMPYLMLTDLDTYACPGELIGDWINVPFHHNLIFRVAVREVESWLLADRGRISDFLGVPKSRIPANIDSEKNPKQFLVNLARKSRFSKIIKAIVPPANSTARIGVDYNHSLIWFVREKWRAEDAARNSESLRRCITRLKSFTPVSCT